MSARMMFALITVVTACPFSVEAQQGWLTIGLKTKPVQVARGRGFIVHALPTGREKRFLLLPTDYMLLHTSIPDGKLKVVMSSGEIIRHSPPMGIDRTSYERIRLCGVLCKKQRLFVLTSHHQAGIIHTPGAPKIPKYGAAHYRLTLYDARDAEPQYRLNLEKLMVKDAFPANYEAGPLKWENGTVKVQNLTVAIHRDQLSIVKPPK